MYRAPPPARPANSRMYRRPPFGNSSQYLNFRSFCAREAIASQILTRASRKGRSSRRGAETNTRRLRRGYGEPRRRTRSPESRDHSTAVMATTRDAAPLTLAVRLFRVCLACCLPSCELVRSRRHFPGVLRSGFLFRSRLRFHAVRTVEAGMTSVRLFVHHRLIDVRVMNDVGVHARHGGVVTEGVSFPAAAPVTVSEVAIAVVNAAVKTDSRTPVTLVKHVNAVVPAPPGRRPKQTYCGRRDPDSGYPVIVCTAPGPVTGGPDIAFHWRRRLFYYRQNRRSKIDRYAYLRERRERQCDECKSSQNNGT